MKRIVITGANGLLGEACCRLLSDDYVVIPVTRADVDFSDLQKLSDFLGGLDFDYMINNAALSGLEQCLENPEIAAKVNMEAPRLMAEICQQKGAKMMQVSTDYVLDGRENKIHGETAPTRASSIYSQTKLGAEHEVMRACEGSIVTRVSWLFGRGRATFVNQVLNSALRGERARYIGDKFSVPNFCDDLVPAMSALLQSELTGVVHLTCDSEPESWFSYAEKIIGIAKSIGLLSEGIVDIGRSKMEDITFFKQERPRYTAMKPIRLANEINLEVRNWEDGLREYLGTRKPCAESAE